MSNNIILLYIAIAPRRTHLQLYNIYYYHIYHLFMFMYNVHF